MKLAMAGTKIENVTFYKKDCISYIKERTMNKKELKRRGKGLLALLLAFMMMFGSSMTVFAG